MYLVVGLAIAGLAGIVAAFYFSSRSGKRGGKRLRAGGSGRVAANRAGAAGRPGQAPRTGQTEFALRASGPPRTGGDSRLPGTRAGALTESWPSSPSDLEDFQPDDAWPGDSAATDQGLRAADQGVRAARADADAFRDDKPRRRVGFRKGADVDEELWPADSFGGVSDEQFWDDLASDKPLTTTARTAQQEAGPRSRLLGNGPAADSPGRRAAGGGAYPGARPAPEPAAERTSGRAHRSPAHLRRHPAGQEHDAPRARHAAALPERAPAAQASLAAQASPAAQDRRAAPGRAPARRRRGYRPLRPATRSHGPAG